MQNNPWFLKNTAEFSPSIGFYCLNSCSAKIIHTYKENLHEGKQYWKWIFSTKQATDYWEEIKTIFHFDDKDDIPIQIGELVFDTANNKSIIYFGNRLSLTIKLKLIKEFSLSPLHTRFVYERQYQFPLYSNIKDNLRENYAIIKEGTFLSKRITNLPVNIFVDENRVWKKKGLPFFRFQANTDDKRMPSKFCIPITISRTEPKVLSEGIPFSLKDEQLEKIKHYVKNNAEFLFRLSADEDFDIFSYIEIQKK
ncbi:hypothetical protein E4O00_09305 [Treponema sp. OMZ 788]|uniref:hypothetical protein n=1 Tax=Treponema sp. OMZ 788 TaxID=2563664 RepID=UPI0020A235C4|nr:hypothetical protein [Treponema sp. OMZ 788]UTC64058.1 hypothetical protein E4O00_09305 [Treponema sp. OMZ 788]